jgi:UvrD-like helicase C-terminal domain
MPGMLLGDRVASPRMAAGLPALQETAFGDRPCVPVRPRGHFWGRTAPCQGSEYPAVVIPVLTQHYAMLQRNLLYTGVTRGKRLVVLVGMRKDVAIAVRTVSGRRRWSKLKDWLSTQRAYLVRSTFES